MAKEHEFTMALYRAFLLVKEKYKTKIDIQTDLDYILKSLPTPRNYYSCCNIQTGKESKTIDHSRCTSNFSESTENFPIPLGKAELCYRKEGKIICCY